MKIALIGIGKTGSLVRTLAEKKGHEIVAVVTRNDEGKSVDELAQLVSNADAAIDFSTPERVRQNVEACVAAGVPLVEGTTGWNAQRDEIETLVREKDGTMVFGANFSIGVNLFYRIVDHASELFARFPEYEAFIEEQHHSGKKDAPSGTALKLKDFVSKHIEKDFSVSSTRAGNIPGTHRVGFDGQFDQILLQHLARSGEGFAAGALMAAEWIVGKKGFYEFGDVLMEVLD